MPVKTDICERGKVNMINVIAASGSIAYPAYIQKYVGSMYVGTTYLGTHTYPRKISILPHSFRGSKSRTLST